MAELSRRGFLAGLGAVLAAPAVIHYANAMPIKGRRLVIIDRPMWRKSFFDCDIIFKDGGLLEDSRMLDCTVEIQGQGVTMRRCILANTLPADPELPGPALVRASHVEQMRKQIEEPTLPPATGFVLDRHFADPPPPAPGCPDGVVYVQERAFEHWTVQRETILRRADASGVMFYDRTEPDQAALIHGKPSAIFWPRQVS